ncbi:hypothetical protein KQX54_006533 [Cotesia glomerata]|uniref:Uncharacterized protein n=1 Tax=Cotesia glomerata TaxID=32391 RepID=A0AAV7I5Q7_COTGL|nr:hypothetical protein KQX54_006533 [Cotesia glomerata]
MNGKKAASYFSERLIDVKIDFLTFQQYASHYFSRACNNSDKSFTGARIIGKETVSTLKLTRTTTSFMSCSSLVSCSGVSKSQTSPFNYIEVLNNALVPLTQISEMLFRSGIDFPFRTRGSTKRVPGKVQIRDRVVSQSVLKVIFNETRPLVAGKFPAIASANVKEDEQDVEVKKKRRLRRCNAWVKTHRGSD